MKKPIENYNQMLLDANNYITTHEGVKGEFVKIFNEVRTNFLNAKINKLYTTEDRPVKRVKLTINIGVAMLNNSFMSYLTSSSDTPQVFISDLTTDNPTISIKHNNGRSMTFFTLDDSIISDIKIESEISEITTENFDGYHPDRYTIMLHNLLSGLDYKIYIVIDK